MASLYLRLPLRQQNFQGIDMESYMHKTADVSPKSKIGENCRIWHHAQIRENAELGKNCVLGKNVYIDAGVKIGSGVKIENNACVYNAEIGDDVLIGPHVTFTNDPYPRAFIWDKSRVGKKIVVKKGASIGANSTILCGVVIGEYAMVGAGSVVTKDVPAHALVYGNPAKIKGFVCICGMKSEKKQEKAGSILFECPKCRKTFEVPKEVFEK